MNPNQQTVLDAFQRKFCKVAFTDNQKAQFLWLWRRIERTLNDNRRTKRSGAAERTAEETTQDDRGGDADDVPAVTW